MRFPLKWENADGHGEKALTFLSTEIASLVQSTWPSSFLISGAYVAKE